jgi:SOS-response transcriptional repressor LexA
VNYTPRQLQIMGIIRDHIAETGLSPTLGEIGSRLGTHRVTVHQHIAELVRKGAIEKLPQRSRSIVVKDPDFLGKSGYHNLKEHVAHTGATVEMREEGRAIVVLCHCGDEIIVERK